MDSDSANTTNLYGFTYKVSFRQINNYFPLKRIQFAVNKRIPWQNSEVLTVMPYTNIDKMDLNAI